MTCKLCNDTGEQRYWEGRWRDEKAENERLRAALKPFSDLAHVVLAEAPADAGYVSLFVDSAGRSHRITLDQLRAADHQQSPNQEK